VTDPAFSPSFHRSMSHGDDFLMGISWAIRSNLNLQHVGLKSHKTDSSIAAKPFLP
jgi:hypothetical protein